VRAWSFAVGLWACADRAPPQDSAAASPPQVRVATQNAGTSPELDWLEESALRSTCEGWYENNLCLLESEAHLAAALAADLPEVIFLQEIWHSMWCLEGDRPPEVQAEPFACAGQGEPLDRFLPAGYEVACAAGYPDNCVAWDPAAFTPDAAGVVDLEAPCSRAGRIATLAGHLGGAPAVLAVVHTGAGVGPEDFACRAEEIATLQVALEGVDPAAALIVGGDFNHDPEWVSEDAEALAALLDATGMDRLEDDGPTLRLAGIDLDLVLTRGVDAGACAVRFVDEGANPIMFDHGLVSCRP